jgi:2-polyprenyl-6-methoxyphenol hydroxylase-like FAD-dependent oxidoreductase
MAKHPHAEIAGAGIAGLTTAVVLGQRGWTVRVHERGPELREIGAGIGVFQNGCWALRQIGVFDRATENAEPLHRWELFDERRRKLQDVWMMPGASESYAILRTVLHRTLADAAVALGAEIVTDSPVKGATADGELVLTTGRRLHADLVIGADGVGSKVRDSLGMAKAVKDLKDGCGRHLIVRKPIDPKLGQEEHWHGARRLGVVPCAPDQVYVYLCCPAADGAARDQGRTRAPWAESFPHLRDVVERVPDGGVWASFSDVAVHSWISGRVALVGDACHAMSPNLGQAANVAMANAVALGQALDACGNDVLQALPLWQTSERRITDSVQQFSRFYGTIGTHWPRQLLAFRSALIWTIARSDAMQRRINAGAYHVPNVGGGSPGHREPAMVGGAR